ncbi:hypothetical protein N9M57_02795 [Opitutales bacterium]|jgi:hypothetical protein|nr:hypothetical protein [Opitutales bacterium]
MNRTHKSLILLVSLLSSLTALAFPPAPYYTLYGMVRDQIGQTLTAEGAVVVLLKEGVEVGRTPITANRIDQSYELNVRMDQTRSGTALYSDKAVSVGGLFSLVVEMNGSTFYPIEVSGTLQAGSGGERTRLDLTLGSDSDGDGLPDVWEQWQLYQAGQYPDADGIWDLSQITAEGDFDGDGQSDGFEYIAGTFAGDATEVFGLEIKEKLAGNVRLEFYAITGKAYTIERSSDMLEWQRVNFAAQSAQNTPAASYVASGVGQVPVFLTPASDAKEFYRLSVR